MSDVMNSPTDPYVLKKPFKIGNQEITQIQLKEPTTAMVERFGLPYVLAPDLTSQPVPAVCSKYISELGGISPSEVKKLGIVDYQYLMMMVVALFSLGR